MKIRVSNMLFIKDPTDIIRKYCAGKLILENPEYTKKERMGLWTGNTPRKIYLFEIVADELWLPFGCLKDIWNIHPYKDDYHFEICPKRTLEYKSGINLYPYQEQAVKKALEGKNGVLVMPCGSGKTQCGLEIIARIGGRALWLTHTHKLLNQSKQRAISCLQVPRNAFGTITEGKVNIGTHITFATVQTLSRLDLSNYRDLFDILIVDEAHHCAGSPTRVTQFYKVSSAISARYKIGLTATPRRADGMERSMFALLGDIIYEVPRSIVNTCPVKLISYNTGYTPDYASVTDVDGTIDYPALIRDLISNKDRFDFIIKTLSEIDPGTPVLVLASRIKYLQALCSAYIAKTGRKAAFISSLDNTKEAKKRRENAINALNAGDIDCVFASYKLAAEGLDCPNLRYVFLATPEKDKTIITQSAGRVGRVANGKKCGFIVDFIDDFPMFQSYAKKRKNIIENL